MAEKHPLTEALRAEILKLATDGDPQSDGALTESVLLRIMRVAKTGRELLVSLNASPSNLAAMLRRPSSPFGIPVLGQNAEDDGFGFVDTPIGSALPYVTSSPSENFGMTAMREIIAAAKNLNGGGTSPAKLVEALVIAKENGLGDVVRHLEEQLGIGKPVRVPALPKLETLVSAGDGLTQTVVQEAKP